MKKNKKKKKKQKKTKKQKQFETSTGKKWGKHLQR
jgi:hypothetical protein